jgi:MFS superfamily sulfate permease-like transporter
MPTPLTSRLPDLIAGLSIAGLLLPEAVAYAGLANLPPQAGVVALFAGLICYGVIGRSRYAIVSATSSSAIVLAAATAVGGDPAQRIALASLLVIGSGVAFLALGALRLGALSNLVARPVLRGYTFGLALVIIVKQWPQLTGLQTQQTGFFALLGEIAGRVGDWHIASLACGGVALAALFALNRLHKIPGTLIVIVAGIAASPWLSAHAVAITGAIDLQLQLLKFVWPARSEWLGLSELALALMFVLYAESYAAIRAFALKHDEPVRANRDLVALGLANVASGLLQGMPVGAGYSATSANEAAGARSRLAGLCAAVIVLVLLVLLLPWIERTPRPVLAAIVIHAVSRSLRFTEFREYFVWRRGHLPALAAVLGVLVFGVLHGLLFAIAFNVALLLRSLATPQLSVLGRVGEHDYVSIARYPKSVTTPDMLVLRPEQPLFFANAEALLAQARAQVARGGDEKLVVLSLEESPDLDGTTLEVLREFCQWLERRGVAIRVARLKDRARDALLRARLPQLPPSALDYSSVDDAVRDECIAPPR